MSKEQSFKKESHFRSVIKGISWRFVAFIDTVLVTLLITWLIEGEANFTAGFTIAGVEFFIKLLIYYVHERAWQLAWKDGVVTKLETLFKTITWRLVATTSTFIISGKVLGEFGGVALFIALAESFTKFALFYLHERLWLKIPLGTIRHIVDQEE